MRLKHVAAACALLAGSIPLPSCSLFDDGPPRVKFVRPQPGDTVAAPVLVEIDASDRNLRTVQLDLDSRKLTAYTTASIRDSFLIAPGGHTLEAIAQNEGGRTGTATVIIMVR
jgi:hypothetical protein